MVLARIRHFSARVRRTTALLLALILATGLGIALVGNWPEPVRETPSPEFTLAPPCWPLVLAPLVLNDYLHR
jgi:hypothetical protein